MKNILYVTYVDYLENAFPGVQAKIDGQIEAFHSRGYRVDRVNQYGKAAQLVDLDTMKTRTVSGISRRFAILNAVKQAVGEKQYAAAYIRFQFFSEDVRRLTKLLESCGTKVLMEFPTFPYEGELHQQGKKGEIKLLCDRMFRKSCAAHIRAFVTQAEDPSIYGTRCIRVLNGLDFSTHGLREIRTPREHELHCLAVASMLPWHGYDRFLRGMEEYYRQPSADKIILHLVGEGKELAGYRRIVEEGGLEPYVVFHGMQGGAALEHTASLCDIAVGSLGAFRIHLNKLSTLKSREYCAWGFPTVNCTPTDILDPADPDCLFVPEDESPVPMDEVISFFHRVYFESGKTAEQIAKEIRAAAEACSDVHAVFAPVIDDIEKR